MTERKGGLGRGLASLIPSGPPPGSAPVVATNGTTTSAMRRRTWLSRGGRKSVFIRSAVSGHSRRCSFEVGVTWLLLLASYRQNNTFGSRLH